MLYRRGRVWWFEFTVGGRRYRETTRTKGRTLAATVERKRRREIEENINGVRPRVLPPLFPDAAEDYLARKKPGWAPKTYIIETTSIEHLKPHLGRLLVTDITDRDISNYQQARQDGGAAPKTINNEVGTLRAILRRHRLWAQLAPDVRMLPVHTDIGVALTPEQEEPLLKACATSRSRSLLPAVTLGIQTGLRNEELRFLRWRQVDLLTKAIRVGKSKTPSGEGRVVPLNKTAAKVLTTWAQQFPGRRPEHYVFPSERVGFSGNREIAQAYGTNPTTPITSWKVAWTSARKVAEVQCRFHDLRHTCITRLLEAGVPLCQWWLRSWVGAQRRRPEWRSDTLTLEIQRNDERWKRSTHRLHPRTLRLTNRKRSSSRENKAKRDEARRRNCSSPTVKTETVQRVSG